MSEQPLASPPDASDAVTDDASPHGRGQAAGRVPSGRPWLLLGAVVVLGALFAGLVLGGRSRRAATRSAIGGEPGPTKEGQSAPETRTEFDVQGLGTLPSLGLLRRWELGQGQPMVDDVSRELAVSVSGRDGFRLLRLDDNQPPSEVGAFSAEDMLVARLGAGGRRVVTIGSNGWSGDGSFRPAAAAVYDSADPDHPRKVGEIKLETDNQVFQPWGDYLLMGESRMNPTPLAGSLRVIQLLGPDAGKEVGRLEGETRHVAVDGDRAYVIRSCGGRSQPTAPPEFFPDQSIQPPPMMMETDPTYPDCLAVVDLSDPARPGLIAEVEMPLNSYPATIAAHDGYVYMAQPHEGILIADARGAGAPVFLGGRTAKNMKWPFLMDNYSSGGYLGLVVNGSVLYFGNHTTIAAFDLSAPEAPKPVAAFEFGEEGYIKRLILNNDRLYVSAGNLIESPDQVKLSLWVIDAPADPAGLPR